jgi:outer membrane protein, heavy metal efflux system
MVRVQPAAGDGLRLAVRFLAALLLVSTCVGCSSIPLSAIVAHPTNPPVTTHTIRTVSFQQEEPGRNDRKMNGHAEPGETKLKITLPLAVELCVAQNFRLLAGVEKIRQAEADLVTASLIPNPTLLADYQYIPLQQTNLHEQLGPPEADAILSIPIDWLLFGKRAAARQAASLGIAVAQWDFNDLQRVQVSRTVDAFYETLMSEEMLKHAEENHSELLEIEKSTKALIKAGKADALEGDRIKLAVLEAYLEQHARELALAVAKTKLRPLIGKSAADPDFEVDGVLTVKVVVPTPKLADLIALADRHRPDLKSDQLDIDRKQATIELERRRAKPQVALAPGWMYQNQQYIDGFRNGSMLYVGVSTSLPITDRNQGNIRKAQSQYREAQRTYLGNRADALAEVEATVEEYDDAVLDVTRHNSPATLKAAHDLKKSMDAAYKDGKRGLLDYLNAHQAYRVRLDRIVEFESNYWRKLNKLNAVVGVQAFSAEKGAVLKVGENGK